MAIDIGVGIGQSSRVVAWCAVRYGQAERHRILGNILRNYNYLGDFGVRGQLSWSLTPSTRLP